MIGAYLRLALIVVSLIAALALFLFAFTAAAIIAMVVALGVLIFGRKAAPGVWVLRHASMGKDTQHRPPVVIDHDPNDLPDPPGDSR
ncbi:MAG: hypothetical protein SFV19_15530 [Rhodospirillaceae bacterium]|nr:hypothetical protein [Rhodospirillaceae bacterium]